MFSYDRCVQELTEQHMILLLTWWITHDDDNGVSAFGCCILLLYTSAWVGLVSRSQTAILFQLRLLLRRRSWNKMAVWLRETRVGSGPTDDGIYPPLHYIITIDKMILSSPNQQNATSRAHKQIAHAWLSCIVALHVCVCVCLCGALISCVCIYRLVSYIYARVVRKRQCACVHYFVLLEWDVELVLLSITIVLQCINSTNAC